MKLNLKIIVGLFCSTSLMACGSSVDRAGTIDMLASQASSLGITVDEACLEDAFSEFSDDELLAANEALEGGSEVDPEVAATVDGLFEAMMACSQI